MENPQIISELEENRGEEVDPDRLRALILDDDEWALRLIRYVLEESLPGVEIVERQTPDIVGDFDVYIVDNDFGGARRAAQIVPSIREGRPEALVVAFSATLDRTTLKTLLNAGCNAAFEKSRPNDLEALSRVAREYAKSRRTRSEPGRGVIASARAIRDLIHEWNVRLDQEVSEVDGG
jgi:DNA-binding NarL/FixJ family response regulator